MLLFNAHPFGDSLRAQLHTLSRAWLQMSAWRRCSSPEGNDHSGSKRLALYDSGCALGLVQSPDLGLSKNVMTRNACLGS